MKPYLVFGGDFYYPRGGWDDLKGEFDSLEEAITQALHHWKGELYMNAIYTYDWAQIVHEGEIIHIYRHGERVYEAE